MVSNKRWRFRLQRTFFGLDDGYIKGVYEELFLLKYHGGWGFTEAYNLPILIRRWFLERLQKQFDDEADAHQKAARSRKS